MSPRRVQQVASCKQFASSRNLSVSPFTCWSRSISAQKALETTLDFTFCSRTRPAHSHLRSLHWGPHVNAGGARKIIEQQQEEEQPQEKSKPHHTQFDKSLGARKAKTAQHQSVIAHMSDVRTPRSLLSKSTKQQWEVSLRDNLCTRLVSCTLFYLGVAFASQLHQKVNTAFSHSNTSNPRRFCKIARYKESLFHVLARA